MKNGPTDPLLKERKDLLAEKKEDKPDEKKEETPKPQDDPLKGLLPDLPK
jgi:hypothetical protein